MDPVPERLTAALADRYRVYRQLGQGGMATVFLAEDLKHRRQLAVKVLRPELAATLGPDRFVREIAIAAKLNHPHILLLIDSGEADGFLYYVMPYVEGESLRDRLNRDGTLPVPEAVRITAQVASALTYAHERGVIHRDVKPENILLAGDQAIVADFGIARALELAGGEKLTGTGWAIGTPAYMSPEQAYGQGDIDGRSDVYALGCVMYEMVTGHTPFEGGTAQALLAKHAVATVPSLRTLDPALPLFVERAVQRALAKDPAARFATPTAFAETLSAERVVSPVGRRRLAVLPPVNITNDPEQAYLILGLHEALISKLGQGDVAVLARTSVLQYGGTQKPVRDIARELGVDAVIESSLFRAEHSVGIQARLVDGATEEAIWSGSYEGDLRNVFGLYRDLAGAIAGEIHHVLAPGKTVVTAERRVTDPVTYENYMRGRVYQERFTPNDLETALQYYGAALKTAPDYAPAYAGISLVWGSKIVMGLVPPLEGGPQWREAAERAVALDPMLADGYQALGQAYAFYEWDWPRAEAAFERAVTLNPNDPQTRTMYSHFLVAMRRPAAAIMEAHRALELDPFNPFHHSMYGMVLMLSGRYEDAIAHLTQSLQMEPANVLARLGLAGSHLCLGALATGLAYHAELFDSLRDGEVAGALRSGVSDGDLRRAFLRAGEILEARSRTTFVKPIHVVIMFDWGGDVNRAFHWIDRAYDLKDHDMAYFAAAPWSPEFRTDPRYSDVLRRMKFPPPEVLTLSP